MVLLNLREFLGDFLKGRFLKRLNRFVVLVEVDGKVKKAHLSDTGRLRELLVEGAPVLLSPNPRGKLDFKFVAVKKEREWVLLNTSVHSKVARRVLEEGLLGFRPKRIKPEFTFGSSRIDFLVDDSLLLEVKGCNLVVGRTCLFPDASTERGRRHVEELLTAVKRGFRGAFLFLAFRECSCFRPNRETDPEFSNLFYRALEEGIEFYGVKPQFLPSGEVVYRGSLNLCP